MSLPIIITPSDFKTSLNLPSFGNKISKSEAYFPNNSFASPNVIFFIGGFADSYTKALFSYFSHFTHQDFCKFYGTYDCAKYLPTLLEQMQDKKIYLITHSWGSRTTNPILAKLNLPITYFLTLDYISYTRPKPIASVQFWENIYIGNHWYFDQSNIVALLGHPQGFIKFANLNTKLNPPYTHTSIGKMLQVSKLYKDLKLLI